MSLVFLVGVCPSLSDRFPRTYCPVEHMSVLGVERETFNSDVISINQTHVFTKTKVIYLSIYLYYVCFKTTLNTCYR